MQRMVARPEVLMQVHLAGLAAEHRLTGRRSRSLKTELGFSILCLTTPGMSDTAEEMGLIGRDEYMVVEEILRMGCVPETDAIKAEVERFYLATQESLAAVWPSVSTLAEALLKHGELDRNGILRTLVGNIYDPVFAVQRAHGLRSK